MSAGLVALVPPAVVTVTSTAVLTVPAGLVAVHVVVLAHETPVAAVEPKAIVVAPGAVRKPAPVTVTVVPPAGGPPVGESALTVGTYANLSAGPVALVPPGVVTVTSTTPAPGGDATVQVVALHDCRFTWVTALAPKWTAVAPFRSVPVIVTVVEPSPGPDIGLTEVTTGAGTV